MGRHTLSCGWCPEPICGSCPAAHAHCSAAYNTERFGWDVATSIKLLGQQAEHEAPTLQQHSAWGARTDTGGLPLRMKHDALPS